MKWHFFPTSTSRKAREVFQTKRRIVTDSAAALWFCAFLASQITRMTQAIRRACKSQALFMVNLDDGLRHRFVH